MLYDVATGRCDVAIGRCDGAQEWLLCRVQELVVLHLRLAVGLHPVRCAIRLQPVGTALLAVCPLYLVQRTVAGRHRARFALLCRMGCIRYSTCAPTAAITVSSKAL